MAKTKAKNKKQSSADADAKKSENAESDSQFADNGSVENDGKIEQKNAENQKKKSAKKRPSSGNVFEKISSVKAKKLEKKAKTLKSVAKGHAEVPKSQTGFQQFSTEKDGLEKLDSEKVAMQTLEQILSPLVAAEEFFKTHWEKQVLHIQRNNDAYFSQLFSRQHLDETFNNNTVYYGKNVNVVRVVEGAKETVQCSGQATALDIAQFLEDGWSLQLVNPQLYNREILFACSHLHELFCSFTGANVYVTPKSSQGFLPHSDDIDAYICQCVGRKYWKVYRPNAGEELPLESSCKRFPDDVIGRDFAAEETAEMDVAFEGFLIQGDTLYIPRGFVHEGNNREEDSHSIHVTLSANRKNTWIDFGKMLLPELLNNPMEFSMEFRHSLPPRYLSYTGVYYQAENATDKKLKQEFRKKFEAFMKDLTRRGIECIETGCDMFSEDFFKTAMKPALGPSLRKKTVFREQSLSDDVMLDDSIDLSSKVKFVTRYNQRLVEGTEEESRLLLYRSFNSLEYGNYAVAQKESETSSTVASLEAEPAILTLQKRYPEFTKVSDLPCATDELKLELAQFLFTKGILVVENEK